MFLLHPRVGQLLNTRAIHTPFAADGFKGSVENVLHAQQANRLLAFGQQCLASSGGTASVCGGAAGPGGGPAGALCAPFSGVPRVAAGGSNGAAGGVPVGGQEIGRNYPADGYGAFNPYILDDVEEVEPILLDAGSLLLERAPRMAERSSSVPRFRDTLAKARKALLSALASLPGAFHNNMPFTSSHQNKPTESPDGPSSCTCPKKQ
jgi:hypothetical protein